MGVVGEDEIGGATGRNGEIDLRHIGAALGRKRAWIVGSTVFAFVAMLIFVSVIKPRYTATASVLIENQESYFTRPDKNPDPTYLPDAEAVQSQVSLVMSRDLARRAVKVLDLQGNPEFDPLANGIGPLSRVMILLGMQRDPTRLSPEDRVLETYFEKLTVFPVVKSRVLSIEFSSNDAVLAARAANTIADLYLDIQSKAKRDSAHTAADSLGLLIGELKTKLATAEQRAQDFRARTGLYVTGTNNLTLNAQQLSEVSTQLALARTQQADAQAKARLIRDMLRQGRAAEVPDVAANDLVRNIATQRATLKAQIALEGRTLLPGHPRIKELTAQLGEMDAELAAAADKAARTLENDSKLAGSRVENLLAAVDAQKKVAGVSSGDEIKLRTLETDVRLLKEQIDSSMAKYQEAQARDQALMTPADARVISRAAEPQLPSFPKKVPMLIFATLAGLIFSTGAIVAGEMLTGSVEVVTPAAPVVAGQVPLFAKMLRKFENLAMTPDAGAATPGSVIATPDPFRLAADPIGDLAQRIASSKKGDHAVIAIVTGVDRAAGAPAMAIALARALSRRKRAILVNLDHAAAAIDRIVQLDAPADGEPEELRGLADLLAGEASFAEVIHRDRRSRLHVAPASGEALDGLEGFDLVIDALIETYDFVVLATPSIAVGDRAVTLAPYADYAVLAAAGDVNAPYTAQAYADLARAGAGEVLVLSSAAVHTAGVRNAA